MSEPIAEAQPAQIPVDTIFAAPAEPPSTTLGQTPHEPKTRPWEMELLLSGALVFSLMQLPGQVTEWFHAVSPKLDGAAFIATLICWFYLRLALYSVIAGFSIHLIVRAYWVAVIGLEAVFPDGIRWDRKRLGPIMLQIQRERTPSVQKLIDGADRLASIVFASGVSLALLFSLFFVAGAIIVIPAYSLVHLFIRNTFQAVMGMYALIIVCFAPMFIAAMMDRVRQDRIDPEGETARRIRTIAKFYGKLGRLMVQRPLMDLLSTNLQRKKVSNRRMVVSSMLAMGIIFLAGGIVPFGGIFGSAYAFLPGTDGMEELAPRYYQSALGDGEVNGESPQIQSDIVTDPFVRLFIPYRPLRHNQLIFERCPAAAEIQRGETGATRQAVIDCMLRLQPVSLNGQPVSARFRFYTQPKTGLRGIVAYIPTAGLPKGENVLVVGRLPSTRGTDADNQPRAPHRISFWL